MPQPAPIMTTDWGTDLVPGYLWAMRKPMPRRMDEQLVHYYMSLGAPRSSILYRKAVSKKGETFYARRIVVATFGDMVRRHGIIHQWPSWTSTHNEDMFRSIRNPHRYNLERWFGTEDLAYIEGEKLTSPHLQDALEQYDQLAFELRINPETQMPRPRRKFTSQPTGVFTFGRAAPTLHAFPCYTDPTGADECIPLIDVETMPTEPPSWRQISTGKSLDRTGFEMRHDGRPKFRTATRTVYATHQQTEKVVPWIHIYVQMGAPYDISADDLRWNVISAMLTGRLLEEAGFKTKITTVFITRHLKSHDIIILRYSVKDYADAFDFNQGLIMGGDPAFLRFEGFQDLCHVFNASGNVIPNGLGIPVTATTSIDDLLYYLGLYAVQYETRLVVSGRFDLQMALDGVRSDMQFLRQLYGQQS